MASKSYVADGTIHVCRFVKPSSSTDFRVEEADSNELTLGISQESGRYAPIPTVTADPVEAAIVDEQLNVFTDPEQVVMLEIGTGGITRGAEIVSDADGKGVAVAGTAATVYQVGAIAEASVAAGVLCPVIIRRYVKTIPA